MAHFFHSLHSLSPSTGLLLRAAPPHADFLGGYDLPVVLAGIAALARPLPTLLLGVGCEEPLGGVSVSCSVFLRRAAPNGGEFFFSVVSQIKIIPSVFLSW